MDTTTLIKGEQKIVSFTVRDATSNELLNLVTATLTFRMVPRSGGSVIEKSDTDFDKASAAVGIIKITLTDDDLAVVRTYHCQLKIVFTNGEIDKSTEFAIKVIDSIV